MSEWTKPVKGADGVWVSEYTPRDHPTGDDVSVVLDDNGMLGESEEGLAVYAPRDIVLRLLAAEASDRLGWVWEVTPEKAQTGAHLEVSWEVMAEGVTFTGSYQTREHDALIASLHGRFLLEDAMAGK